MTSNVPLVTLTKKAQKDLDALPEPIYLRIKQKIIDIQSEKENLDIKKLTNQPGFRLRVGTFRILFIKRQDSIVISRVLHRKDAY